MPSQDAQKIADAFSENTRSIKDLVVAVQALIRAILKLEAGATAESKSSDELRGKVEQALIDVATVLAKVEERDRLEEEARKAAAEAAKTASEAAKPQPGFLARLASSPQGIGVLMAMNTTVTALISTFATLIAMWSGQPTPTVVAPPPHEVHSSAHADPNSSDEDKDGISSEDRP